MLTSCERVAVRLVGLRVNVGSLLVRHNRLVLGIKHLDERLCAFRVRAWLFVANRRNGGLAHSEN